LNKIKQLIKVFAFHKKGFLSFYIPQNGRDKRYVIINKQDG